MSGYVTWGALLWVILAVAIGDVLAHIGSDLAKLAWQRHQARTLDRQS
jgi:hypothetical protein